MSLAALCVSVLGAVWATVDRDALQARLQAIADAKSMQYECAITIALQTGAGLSLSAGALGAFAWGSVTKMATGVALMQHVADGRIALDSPVAPLLDPTIAREGLGSMATLFGPQVSRVTLRHLLGMKSGIPDYDTAQPFPPPPTDPFRASVYAAPGAEWAPAALLNVSWVRKGRLNFPPGANFSYSSTNFVLAGLVLATLADAPSWDSYDQGALLQRLPAAARAPYSHLRFAKHGPPAAAGVVRGFDRTSYNGEDASARPGIDVSAVAGVFGGWTASDLVAPAPVVARLAYDIFGQTGARLLPLAEVQQMIPGFSGEGAAEGAGAGEKTPAGKAGAGGEGRPGGHIPTDLYGLATFNLTIMGVTGQSILSPLSRSGLSWERGYGHLGATYGYDSIVGYFPAIDAAIAIGSNIETDSQMQPSDTLCFVYNAVVASLTGAPEPKCTYAKRSFYGGVCSCGNDYACERGLFGGRCVRSPMASMLSKEDCSKVCH